MFKVCTVLDINICCQQRDWQNKCAVNVQLYQKTEVGGFALVLIMKFSLADVAKMDWKWKDLTKSQNNVAQLTHAPLLHTYRQSIFIFRHIKRRDSCSFRWLKVNHKITINIYRRHLHICVRKHYRLSGKCNFLSWTNPLFSVHVSVFFPIRICHLFFSSFLCGRYTYMPISVPLALIRAVWVTCCVSFGRRGLAFL